MIPAASVWSRSAARRPQVSKNSTRSPPTAADRSSICKLCHRTDRRFWRLHCRCHDPWFADSGHLGGVSPSGTCGARSGVRRRSIGCPYVCDSPQAPATFRAIACISESQHHSYNRSGPGTAGTRSKSCIALDRPVVRRRRPDGARAAHCGPASYSSRNARPVCTRRHGAHAVDIWTARRDRRGSGHAPVASGSDSAKVRFDPWCRHHRILRRRDRSPCSSHAVCRDACVCRGIT